MVDALLLEEDEPARHVVRGMLERREYTVHETTTTGQALEVGGALENLGLLIAAVRLRFGSGIEAALHLHEKFPSLKIVLISTAPPGVFGEPHRALYDKLPSDSVRFVLKPFTYSDLFRTIDSF